MRAFGGVFVRWVLPVIGLIALSLFIWFIGPLFQMLVPDVRRWVLICLLLGMWMVYVLLRLVRGRRRAAQEAFSPMTEVAENPVNTAINSELSRLRQHMAHAQQTLKKMQLSGDRQCRSYQLPWYVLIGPPNAGKTAALINSGMDFPLAVQWEQGADRGQGGTRSCDWWFTDQAVLLDTAGRYTTQDSHAHVDKAAWLGLLDLLKRKRSRRPLDGMFIAISVSDMLLGSDAERVAQAAAIRARIQELYSHLGVRVPIYVTLTKLDLLPGFVAFFEGLSKEERAQVWGMTFALADSPQSEGPLADFGDEFACLEHRLNACLVERLQQERDPARRELIYGFPQHFAALKPTLESFLNAVFKPNAFEDKALLRGVYFTSATQDGSPVDGLIGAMVSSMNLDRQLLAGQAGAGRSYFIEKLLTGVAFKERALVGFSPEIERRRIWLARGGLPAQRLRRIKSSNLPSSGNLKWCWWQARVRSSRLTPLSD